jgi:glucosamine--fructose-6-phosphate aminotransferase (isomerizing)
LLTLRPKHRLYFAGYNDGVADWDTPFTTIRIPSLGEMNPCVILIVGWNLLIEIGLEIGIDLDKPGRACKVGNEFLG